MDLGIGEIAIAIFGAEQIGSFLWRSFEALTDFLGEEGSATMLDLAGKGIALGDYLLNHAVVDAQGIVTGLNDVVADSKVLSFLKTLSTQMIQNGISWNSDEGQSFVKKVFDKVNDFSSYINAAGVAAFIANKIADWRASKNGVAKDEVPVSDEIPDLTKNLPIKIDRS